MQYIYGNFTDKQINEAVRAMHTINEDAICEEDCKTHGTTLL